MTPELNKDLSRLAYSIVLGDDPLPSINAVYNHHSLAVALEIYRNNYFGNLHDTLAGAFPVTQQLVGMDFFRLLSRRFIEQHPSRSGNLHHYGVEMSDFVATFEPAKKLPYLSDVAKLEWACHCAYFAEDAAALCLMQLADIAPDCYPDLILQTHPAANIVSSVYPITSIWQAHQPGAADDFQIDLGVGPCHALVSRDHGHVLVSEISKADARWLRDIQASIPLGVATENTIAQFAEFDVQSSLLNLLQQGALVLISTGEQK